MSVNYELVTCYPIAEGAVAQAHDTEFEAVKITELADKIEKVKESTTHMNLVASQTNELSTNGIEVVELLKNRTKENIESVY